MAETIDLVYDLVKVLDEKQDKQTIQLVKLEGHVEVNTKDLAEHIEGVKQTREIIKHLKKEVDTRFKKLEEPRKFVKTAVKGLAWVAGLATSVYWIYKAVVLFL